MVEGCKPGLDHTIFLLSRRCRALPSMNVFTSQMWEDWDTEYEDAGPVNHHWQWDPGHNPGLPRAMLSGAAWMVRRRRLGRSLAEASPCTMVPWDSAKPGGGAIAGICLPSPSRPAAGPWGMELPSWSSNGLERTRTSAADAGRGFSAKKGYSPLTTEKTPRERWKPGACTTRLRVKLAAQSAPRAVGGADLSSAQRASDNQPRR